GPDAGGDEHGLGVAVAAEPLAVEDGDALAERGHADAGRVVGLALPERGLDAVAQGGGDREVRGSEVTDGQVADGLAAGDELADLGSDAQDLGTGDAGRPVRDPAARRIRRAGLGPSVHLDSPNFHLETTSRLGNPEPGRSTRARDEPAASPLRSGGDGPANGRSEEHTSELQSRENLVCRLLLEKKKNKKHRRQ